MPTTSALKATHQRYFKVDLASLRADRLLDFDLYVSAEGQMILYREKSLPFSDEVRNRLLENKVKQVYIHESQRPKFLGYMESELPKLLQDTELSTHDKAQIVYATSKVIVENFLDHPALAENIRRTERLVEHTVRFLTVDNDAFRNLVELSDEEYKLHSHCVNVCILSIGLARRTGINDPKELSALGIGAMLHDVGKTRIDSRILKKRTPLTHAEFELMKRHVEYGIEILNLIPGLSREVFIPVMQHGEREDGSGYPRGLTGDRIHLFGKIAAITDVFDAMTTDRTFRNADSAYYALIDMLGMPLDQKLLRAFIELLGPDQKSTPRSTTAA